VVRFKVLVDEKSQHDLSKSPPTLLRRHLTSSYRWIHPHRQNFEHTGTSRRHPMAPGTPILRDKMMDRILHNSQESIYVLLSMSWPLLWSPSSGPRVWLLSLWPEGVNMDLTINKASPSPRSLSRSLCRISRIQSPLLLIYEISFPLPSLQRSSCSSDCMGAYILWNRRRLMIVYLKQKNTARLQNEGKDTNCNEILVFWRLTVGL